MRVMGHEVRAIFDSRAARLLKVFYNDLRLDVPSVSVWRLARAKHELLSQESTVATKRSEFAKT